MMDVVKLMTLSSSFLWIACILYMWPLQHRTYYGLRVIAAFLVSGVISVIVNILFDNVLLCSVFLICTAILFEYGCGKMTPGSAVYCAAWAVITHQIANEFVFIFMSKIHIGNNMIQFLCMLLIYLLIYFAAGITIVREMPEDGIYHVGPRQLSLTICLLIIFELFSDSMKMGQSAMTKTGIENVLLMQCYCVTILYLQNTMFRKSAMKHELSTLNRIWYQQKAQYELSRETIALINHKCHDLKHQIAAMRTIESKEKREKYLREIEDSVQIYDAIVKTGNEVLDTVLTEKSLYCAASDIKINCVVDGHQMSVLDPVDVYTVFGNAIDNAIESVNNLKRPEMRIIDVLVYVKKQFLMIYILNPIEKAPRFEGEFPVSTKNDNGYHGFGLKSIQHTIKKYNGFLKIDIDETIFGLKILIPLSGSTQQSVPQNEPLK